MSEEIREPAATNPSEVADAHENETEAEKSARFTRNCRHFIDYINHDWETDKVW